jgi:hypothetical protein
MNSSFYHFLQNFPLQKDFSSSFRNANNDSGCYSHSWTFTTTDISQWLTIQTKILMLPQWFWAHKALSCHQSALFFYRHFIRHKGEKKMLLPSLPW